MVVRGGGCARAIVGLIVLLIIVGVLIFLFVRSGLYNVAASYPDKAPVRWLLSNTSDHSVKRHAAGIKVPPLDDPAMIQAGFNIYRQACEGCHSGPGMKEAKIVKGFNPDPPELTEAASDWKPNELFWITKNGIRMSAMPSWGVAYSDKDIWQVVSFVRRLPKMSPAQYKAYAKKAPPVKTP